MPVRSHHPQPGGHDQNSVSHKVICVNTEPRISPNSHRPTTLSKALPQDVRGGLLRRRRGLVGTVYLGSPAAARLLLRLFLLVELEKLGELLLKTIDLFTDALNIQIVI